jgi:hypothetical protein
MQSIDLPGATVAGHCNDCGTDYVIAHGEEHVCEGRRGRKTKDGEPEDAKESAGGDPMSGRRPVPSHPTASVKESEPDAR